jgi:lipopolysaccharide/colanic/teichoic acid biosynthesis glycosyltransferase
VTRLFDFLISFLGLVILSPIIMLLFILGFFENGSPLFLQKRIGCNQKIFTLIKFRTMRKDAESVATHLINNSMITPYGSFLRSTKLDEIPQLINVLFGDMSFVGPRPCLPNQKKLIREREKRGVFKIKPGITGLAQVSGINMRTPILLAKTDQQMIKKINLYNYFYFILKTLILTLKIKI